MLGQFGRSKRQVMVEGRFRAVTSHQASRRIEIFWERGVLGSLASALIRYGMNSRDAPAVGAVIV